MVDYPSHRQTRGLYEPFNIVEAGLVKLSHSLATFSAIVIALILVSIFIEIVLRALDIHLIEGLKELEIFALVLIALSAMPITFITRTPLQIDMLYTTFRPQRQCRLDLFIYLVCAIICGLLAYRAFISGQSHPNITHVLAIPEKYFVLYSSIMYFVFTIIFAFLTAHVLKEMLNAKDYRGILLSTICAFALLYLPFFYRSTDVYLSALSIGAIGFLLLMFLLVLRFPIGMAMTVVGILGSVAIARSPMGAINAIGTMPFRYCSDPLYLALPTFMLMGEFIYHSGLSKDLFDCAYRWLGKLPGGLASSSVAGCAGFGAVCGESLPTVVTMSTVALPAMKAQNYSTALATGALAAGGTLGILIPPSIGFIFYSIITETSVGDLFLAGIIPGILLATIFIAIITIQVIRKPELAPRPNETFTLNEKMQSTVKLIPLIFIFFIVVGGILEGFFTPGEGGAVGASVAFIYAFLRKKMNMENFKEAFSATVAMCGKVLLILIGVNIFGNFLASSRLPALLASTIIELDVNRYVILAIVVALFIVLGCIMNVIPMMLLTLPSIYPTIEALGFDLVWFGVVCVLVMEMGMITPPLGMNVFTLSSLEPDVPMTTIFRGVIPFFIGMLICVLLVIAFPQIALFLVN